MFVFWSADEIKQAILRMERQLTTGATQISSPTEGSTTLLSRRQAKAQIRELYTAYQSKTGIKLDLPPAPQIRTYLINVSPDLGDDGSCL